MIDKDPQAIAVAQELAAQDSRVTVVHSGFGDLAQALDELEVGPLQGVMMDLGISSPQIDDAQRGFSLCAKVPWTCAWIPAVV